MRGAVAVEAMITLPLLLLVSGGMFDFGLLIRQHGVIATAARAGARGAASVTNTNSTLIMTVACQSARNYLADSKLDAADFEVLVRPVEIAWSATMPKRNAVSVTVRHMGSKWYVFYRNAYRASSTSIFLTESGGSPDNAIC